jgi:hypothetical protein
MVGHIKLKEKIIEKPMLEHQTRAKGPIALSLMSLKSSFDFLLWVSRMDRKEGVGFLDRLCIGWDFFILFQVHHFPMVPF